MTQKDKRIADNATIPLDNDFSENAETVRAALWYATLDFVCLNRADEVQNDIPDKDQNRTKEPT